MSVGRTVPRSNALPRQKSATSVNDSTGRWLVMEPVRALLSSRLTDSSALIGGLAASSGAVHWAPNALVVHTWMGTPSSPLAYRSRFGSTGSGMAWYLYRLVKNPPPPPPYRYRSIVPCQVRTESWAASVGSAGVQTGPAGSIPIV